MKLIIITGGVLSGIGKGITGASIGALIKPAGYNIFMQKLDGYLNVDPGTMNPTQHGEVFVMEDGTEADLDLWHYERFVDIDLNKHSTRTSGRIFEEIIQKERQWGYLGQTVQIIPHVTDMIKEKVRQGYIQSGADVGIIEIGGTVGDMENEYMLEAMRQLRHEIGKENMVFVHLTYLPYLLASKELKTKPTQASVRDLQALGISPDFLVVRADTDIQPEILTKISYMCGLPLTHVIPAPTVDTIYRIPVDYHQSNVGIYILDQLQLGYKNGFDLQKRETLLNNIYTSKKILNIALVGKYVSLEDAYYSLNEGLKIAGFQQHCKVKLHFIDAEQIEREGTGCLQDMDGICVPWGFGTRGIEGMIRTAEYARVSGKPYLGICLGSQIMAVEFARNVLGIADATSAEFDEQNTSSNHIIHIMESQKSVLQKWGSMRLGSYPCALREGSKVEDIYTAVGTPLDKGGQGGFDRKTHPYIYERHRHRYEFNTIYREQFEKNGFLISGTSPDGKLVEMVELVNHPFMIATQAHPELKSRPTNCHPLFVGFIQAML